jgi:tight adherence protein C
MIIDRFLEMGPHDDASLDFFIGLVTFLVILALYRVILPRDTVKARARAYLKRRREPSKTSANSMRRSGRQRPVTFVRELLKRLKLTRGEEVRKAADFLAQAGWRSSDAVTVFLGLRLGMPLGLGIVAYGLAPSFAPLITTPMRAMCGMAGIMLGSIAPSLFVKNASQSRRKKIQQGLPDALDLFVICAEAGLSMDAAITRVAREIGPNSPELADELELTAVELGFLPNRSDALTNLAKRLDMASVRGLVNTLAQTERYGTPLAKSLRVLALEFRNARMMKAEEKAARLPATLSVPMIVFILPPLFSVLLGPAIIQVLKSLHR